MSIRKYVDDRYLVPAGKYIGRIHAVSQKCKEGRSWTVIAVEIADGFFQSRLVFDIIRRGGFSKEAVQHDRDREASLVALGGKKRKYTRACRGLVGRLVEIEVVPADRPVSHLTGARPPRSTSMFICQRCRNSARVFSMSFFCEQVCCIECLLRERQHPDFPRALAAEEDAVKRGDLNFPGIGLPDDLRHPNEGESKPRR